MLIRIANVGQITWNQHGFQTPRSEQKKLTKSYLQYVRVYNYVVNNTQLVRFTPSPLHANTHIPIYTHTHIHSVAYIHLLTTKMHLKLILCKNKL